MKHHVIFLNWAGDGENHFSGLYFCAIGCIWQKLAISCGKRPKNFLSQFPVKTQQHSRETRYMKHSATLILYDSVNRPWNSRNAVKIRHFPEIRLNLWNKNAAQVQFWPRTVSLYVRFHITAIANIEMPKIPSFRFVLFRFSPKPTFYDVISWQDHTTYKCTTRLKMSQN